MRLLFAFFIAGTIMTVVERIREKRAQENIKES